MFVLMFVYWCCLNHMIFLSPGLGGATLQTMLAKVVMPGCWFQSKTTFLNWTGGDISAKLRPHKFISVSHALNRLRGRVVKGMGHLDHVWSYGVREVVSSIPDRGNIVGWVFHPNQVTGKVFSSEHAFPSKFWIYLEPCPRGEAVITGHLRLSSMG